MRRRQSAVIRQQPFVSAGKRNELEITGEREQPFDHLFAPCDAGAAGHKQQGQLVRLDTKLTSAFRAIQILRKDRHNGNSGHVHARARNAALYHAKGNLIAGREIAAHARLHPHAVQIEVGDLHPDRRHGSLPLDVMGQKLGRKKVRAKDMVGSEFLNSMPQLSRVEPLDSAAKFSEQRIARHRVRGAIEVRPDRGMMLDKLDVIIGVERAKAARHQGHHIDMLGDDTGKLHLGLGAQRLCGSAMASACGDAQQ